MEPIDASQLLKARDRLLAGELVAVPTETVYGLAGLASSESALKAIFKTKGRPLFDPLIVHVCALSQGQALSSDWNQTADFLARWFWPGPLTIVVRKAPTVSELITSGLDTVAIRWSSHPLLDELLRLLGEPVAAPSANRFGKTSPSRAEHVRAEFPNSKLMILNGGPCEIGVESTVISVVDPDRVAILRPGAIDETQLRFALSRQSRDVRVERDQASKATPGHLKHHYMPEAPLAFASPSAAEDDIRALAAKALGKPAKKILEMKLSDDATLAARELYSEMRRLCESGADFIWTRDRSESDGLWTAIRDRLARAATYDWRTKAE